MRVFFWILNVMQWYKLVSMKCGVCNNWKIYCSNITFFVMECGYTTDCWMYCSDKIGFKKCGGYTECWIYYSNINLLLWKLVLRLNFEYTRVIYIGCYIMRCFYWLLIVLQWYKLVVMEFGASTGCWMYWSDINWLLWNLVVLLIVEYTAMI
jgi:hypothetical protein